jgi:(p)ppGpp synthase/HD superfamily hydrolase
MTKHVGCSKNYLKAINFIQHAHGRQLRKYNKEPYYQHCIRVANTLYCIGLHDDVVVAALLHDVLEDCPEISEARLRLEFGGSITDLVVMCTQPKITGNRIARKLAFIEQLKQASADAINIKLADLIDNLPSIVENDLGFAQIYVREKRNLFDEVLKLHGHPLLVSWAENILILSENILDLANELRADIELRTSMGLTDRSNLI